MAYRIEQTYSAQRPEAERTMIRTSDVLVRTGDLQVDFFVRAPDDAFDAARLREALDSFRLR